VVSKGTIPEKLEQIPDEYYDEADRQGVIEKLDYETYEAFGYTQKSQKLTKTAYVYLPYGYDKNNKYPVFYLMHGGWSNETTMLGTPDEPHDLKNILDNAMENGKIEPMIVVCPTYNNTSGSDSGDYSLAIKLTDLYHQELLNDLIPAVESIYSTYAEDVTLEGIKNSRDYRAFGGFSMGSVATWRTFEHCFDYFRYYLPMSGNAGNGSLQDETVKSSDFGPDDFFIWSASGTSDFAYSAFKSLIMNMGNYYTDSFTIADNETEGNLSFRELEGAVHDYSYAIIYIYNGLEFFWSR
jgi:predicted peptidase